MMESVFGHDAVGGAPEVRGPDGPWDDEAVLDQALRLVADHHRALGAMLGRPDVPVSLADLRQSPLGRDLRLLAAAGRRTADPAAIQAAAARVADLLLRPLAADDYDVPAWFWATEVGRLLARAERVAHGPDRLLTTGEVAAGLGVTRAVVDRWLADGSLQTTPDEDGRPLVPRGEVERRRAIADELAGSGSPVEDTLLHERTAVRSCSFG